MGIGEPSARTRVRRAPELARYDEATINAIIDSVPFCHVGVTLEGSSDVVVLPFLHARVGSTVLLHGSRSNRLLRSLVTSDRVCATFTSYDGLRIARTGFQSSVAYRSAVTFGAARLLEDRAERAAALDALVESVLPGRLAEIRPPNEAELARTTVVELTIDEASAKVSAGPTEDEPDDLAAPVWAGDVPCVVVYSDPVGASDGAMAGGTIEVPPSVLALLDR